MKEHIEKHATNNSNPGTPCGEKCAGHITPTHGSDSRRTRYPKHPLPPGQDGYRTPKMEDYELQHNVTAAQAQSGGLSNNSSHLRLPYIPPSFLGRQSQNPSHSSLAQSILNHLQWRERIRHYTWTFFAMTMATGGIANVLYSGISTP